MKIMIFEIFQTTGVNSIWIATPSMRARPLPSIPHSITFQQAITHLFDPMQTASSLQEAKEHIGIKTRIDQ